jgi:3'-phosphoadenosine 5'-phosphosulfate sulfotransferase (PAPS reductase)/FAD synthetase
VKHIVCFSGGKDSTALVLWAREFLQEFTAVFCDTGWEHPLTYAYVEQINSMCLDGALQYLRSEVYEDFLECCVANSMFPTGAARFCTRDLKIQPLQAFIEAQDDEVTIYQGIRADESEKRARACDVEYCNEAGGYAIHRPLLLWTAQQVFAWLAAHGIEPNPLYRMGLSRVGCWPCVLANLRDMKAYLFATPEIKPRLIEAELRMRERTGSETRTFFPYEFIPERFCSIAAVTKKGRAIKLPSAQDVFEHIEAVDANQLPMFPARTCMSVYNLCE